MRTPEGPQRYTTGSGLHLKVGASTTKSGASTENHRFENRLLQRRRVLRDGGARPSRLTDGVNQFPHAREMMIVVFGDKIQMVDEPHRRVQTRVENGSRRK